jgi:hypothetical protein
MLSTPSRITADIRRLCHRIGGVHLPVFVSVKARNDSNLSDCFMDVQKQVDEHGGTVQHGWTIWEWPGIFAEGEFHAVWRSPEGELIDVSSKGHGETTILFAADPKRIFKERRVPNVRFAISRDPRVKELFGLHDRYGKLLDELMKDVPFGTQFVLRGEPVEIQKRIARLQFELMRSRDARRAVGS